MKTKGQHPTIPLFDRVKNEYQIDLDAYEFVIQQKASLIKPTIDNLMYMGNTRGAKQRIRQTFELLQHCAKRGIQDTDGALIGKNNLVVQGAD